MKRNVIVVSPVRRLDQYTWERGRERGEGEEETGDDRRETTDGRRETEERLVSRGP
jgi:hypothetical protein